MDESQEGGTFTFDDGVEKLFMFLAGSTLDGSKANMVRRYVMTKAYYAPKRLIELDFQQVLCVTQEFIDGVFGVIAMDPGEQWIRDRLSWCNLDDMGVAMIEDSIAKHSKAK